MEWVARMNNIQSCAREIVDKEMIYQYENDMGRKSKSEKRLAFHLTMKFGSCIIKKEKTF